MLRLQIFLMLAEHGIVTFVAWRTTTNEFEDFTASIGNLMLGTGRNRDCIAWTYGTRFVCDRELALSGEYVIDLLRTWMVVRGCLAADRQASLGEALVANTRVSMRKQFANLRTVLGGEWDGLLDVLNVHQYPGFGLFVTAVNCRLG